MADEDPVTVAADEPTAKGPLQEYSVVYTDRAVNLMSAPFQQCMVEISAVLKDAYQANKVVIIPGSGSFGMEAVARQFGQSKRCMVLRNGYFSFRWSDIFAVCKIPSEEVVLKARPTEAGRQPQFAPMPIAEVVAQIRDSKPDLVLAPHVETATGILLPDDYIAAVAAATHEHGGLLVLDCIASGNVWVDMAATGVDVLISAPQKGWTGPACCGLVMLSQNARAVLDDPDQQPEVNSFCCNLRKWSDVMDAYEDGGFMYYTTLPTDALMIARDVMLETQRYGFERCKSEMIEMGAKVRGALESRGFRSVAAPGFAAPGVVVSYTADEAIGAKFKAAGLQIAAGVPFQLGEDLELGLSTPTETFRLGLFGLDKIQHIDRTVERLTAAIDGFETVARL